MALLGGAGNPVGGSFTGLASGIELVGDHCYIYTGGVSVDATATNVVSTTTGNYYIVGKWQPINFTGGGDNYQFKAYLNNNEVQSVDLVDGNQYTPYQVLFIIIPPYTEVRFTADNVTANNPNDVGVSLTGRIYRTRD